MRFLTSLCFSLALGFSLVGKATTVESQNPFVSSIDELMTIETITILPFSDNSQGIFSRPLEAHVIQRLKDLHRWTFIPSPLPTVSASAEELDRNPNLLGTLTESLTADAFVIGSINRGANGMTLQLDLYLKRDSQLFIRVDQKDYPHSDLKSLTQQMDLLLTRLIRQVPFEGRILSRQGQRVTVNLGQRDGLEVDQELSVVQIIRAQRHPHFNFIVGTDKSTLGQVRVLKVDETLSFGIIVSERERGAIQPNSKISGIHPVTYPDPISEPLTRRQDGDLSFGPDPVAWIPKKPPTFGQVGGQFGLGQFNKNLTLSGEDPLDARDRFAPSILVSGELWLTTQWSVSGTMKQAIVSTANPLPSSRPEKLNHHVAQYELMLGYNLRANYDVWGPQVHFMLGYGSHQTTVDSSEPLSFTSLHYYGPMLALRGSFPFLEDQSLGAGAELSLFLRPKLSEGPETSGASYSNKINKFSAFLYHRYSEHIRLQLNLDFDLFSTQFSGAGTRSNPAISTSHRSTTIAAGVFYLF